jgi:ATP-dependent RNA helicase DHX57
LSEDSFLTLLFVAAFNAYSLLLFCGSIELDTVGRGLVVDGWLRLRGWARIGVLVSRLRTMLDEALAERFDSPSLGIDGSNSIGDRVIEAVKKLIEFNGLDQ